MKPIEKVNFGVSIPSRKKRNTIARRKRGRSTDPTTLKRGDTVRIRYLTKDDGYKTTRAVVKSVTPSKREAGKYLIHVLTKQRQERLFTIPHKDTFITK